MKIIYFLNATQLQHIVFFFFFNDPATPEISPLPLHDALPISARREERGGEPWFKRPPAALFYRLLDRLAGIHIPQNTGDFRLIDRRVADELNRMREQIGRAHV